MPALAGDGYCSVCPVPGWLMAACVGRVTYCRSERFEECPWFRVAGNGGGNTVDQ
jgi:hypothetical protein